MSTFRGARLDRGLSNIEWKLRFADATIEYLSMLASDHTPLLIRVKPKTQSSMVRNFIFNMAWSTHPNFKEMIQTAWNRDGSVQENKSSVARTLEKWNITVFGNIFHRKK